MKIIAEVGSNWATIDDCKKSIYLAKNCGADAVKFQLFNNRALYGFPLGEESPHALPVEWLPILKEKADAFGIEFMCSAFSPELLDVVDPFVSTHKVASSEANHVKMLQKLQSFGKPVLLSTGCLSFFHIDKAINILTGIPVTLLYCVADYPARMVNLSYITCLKSTFGVDVQVGFSDHTIDVYTSPLQAKKLGATVIEKHVNFVGAKGPDADYALNTEEFQNMCNAIKKNDIKESSQTDMRLQHKRRLIAIKQINPGDILEVGENFGIFRSRIPETIALSPYAVDIVNGLKATVEIKQGFGISMDDLE